MNLQKRVTSIRIRKLDLNHALDSRGYAHLAAASGLVIRDGKIYVIADDELSLGIFSLNHEEPGEVIRLAQGELPLDPKLRKQVKPDWESLVALPDARGLLAIPSGSTERRNHGVWIGFENARPLLLHTLDWSPLYTKLRSDYSELNIEGAAFLGDAIFLLQRGNGELGQNALIKLDAHGFLDACCREPRVIPAAVWRAAYPVSLGALEGVPLSFTDLSVDQKGRLVFLAAAEGSQSTYLDGECSGSVVGRLSCLGVVTDLEIIDARIKAEGIAYLGDRVFCVTDADDPTSPAELYELFI